MSPCPTPFPSADPSPRPLPPPVSWHLVWRGGEEVAGGRNAARPLALSFVIGGKFGSPRGRASGRWNNNITGRRTERSVCVFWGGAVLCCLAWERPAVAATARAVYSSGDIGPLPLFKELQLQRALRKPRLRPHTVAGSPPRRRAEPCLTWQAAPPLPSSFTLLHPLPPSTLLPGKLLLPRQKGGRAAADCCGDGGDSRGRMGFFGEFFFFPLHLLSSLSGNTFCCFFPLRVCKRREGVEPVEGRGLGTVEGSQGGRDRLTNLDQIIMIVPKIIIITVMMIMMMIIMIIIII